MRALLREAKPTIGTHLHSTWPGMMEVLGSSGLVDYVELSAQYAPYDLYALDNFAMAGDLYDLPAMIKLDPEPRHFMAQRAIGSGFQSVLFADLRTVKDVEEAVATVRAEPKGKNGSAMNRAAKYFYGGSEEFVKYCDDVVIAIMIEKKSLYEHLEEVLNLDIDMIQFGPSDFSMSLGFPGQTTHPKVVEASENTIKMSLKYDKHPRIELPGVANAEKYLKLGVKDFCIGWDVMVMRDYLTQNAAPLRKLLSS
ncbi:MAG TPA: aldolase/citrate lyase family protein [Nitrososphaerales archaeon]|nr:aldolase/citrate lyase family protein [Nitrososphaerales archaeon]